MRRHYLSLVAAVALVGAIVAETQASPLSTLYNFHFEPTSGGPGTVVHITGVVPRSAIVIRLGIALETSGPVPGGPVTKFQPIAVLGTIGADPVVPGPRIDTTERGIDTTIVMPARMSDGRPITTSNLAIALTFTDNKWIAETAPESFNFTPGILPATGRSLPAIWLLFLGTLSILTAGFVLVRVAQCKCHFEVGAIRLPKRRL